MTTSQRQRSMDWALPVGVILLVFGGLGVGLVFAGGGGVIGGVALLIAGAVLIVGGLLLLAIRSAVVTIEASVTAALAPDLTPSPRTR